MVGITPIDPVNWVRRTYQFRDVSGRLVGFCEPDQLRRNRRVWWHSVVVVDVASFKATSSAETVRKLWVENGRRQVVKAHQRFRPGHCCVYTMLDVNGDVLYIGITNDLPGRLGEHGYGNQSVKGWWPRVARIEVRHTDAEGRGFDRGSAELEEKRLIGELKPVYNVAHNSGGAGGWWSIDRRYELGAPGLSAVQLVEAWFDFVVGWVLDLLVGVVGWLGLLVWRGVRRLVKRHPLLAAGLGVVLVGVVRHYLT